MLYREAVAKKPRNNQGDMHWSPWPPNLPTEVREARSNGLESFWISLKSQPPNSSGGALSCKMEAALPLSSVSWNCGWADFIQRGDLSPKFHKATLTAAMKSTAEKCTSSVMFSSISLSILHSELAQLPNSRSVNATVRVRELKIRDSSATFMSLFFIGIKRLHVLVQKNLLCVSYGFTFLEMDFHFRTGSI